MKSSLFAVCILSLTIGTAFGQSAGPMPAPMPAPVPPPQDRPYPGTIHLAVDATDTAHHIFNVHETIPVASAGPMILLYPQWIPGHHSPNGPLQELAGLEFHANGQRIPWTRDPVNVFAFHIDVPAGAHEVVADFQQLTPVERSVGRITMTHDMFDLEWHGVVLYPAGYYSRDIQIEASLKVRDGWKIASALDPASTMGDTTTFKTVPFNTLQDSPAYAGRYFKRYSLSEQPVPVWLDVVGDRPDEVEAPPEAIAAHRALVAQAYKLYGSHHYDHYDFLLSLSDRQGGIGLEHHRSSEDGTSGDYFTNWAHAFTGRDLLAHEYTHSWNGKFRRPADLWTPNFNVPMRDSLLWVYEGQTQVPGASCWPRARGCGRSSRHSTPSPARLPPTTTGSGGRGGRWRTRRTIRSSPTAGRSRGGAGSAARTTTRKASSSGSTPTR